MSEQELESLAEWCDDLQAQGDRLSRAAVHLHNAMLHLSTGVSSLTVLVRTLGGGGQATLAEVGHAVTELELAKLELVDEDAELIPGQEAL
jgi:hypothetical protein